MISTSIRRLTYISRRLYSIQVYDTPNPDSLKFALDRTITRRSYTLNFRSRDDARDSPLANKLFQLDGIVGVMYGPDFITVTKDETIDWDGLKPTAQKVISDYFQNSGHSELLDHSDSKCQNSDVSSVVHQIESLIETRVRPHVQADGGDVKFHSFKQGILALELVGACSSCPSSTVTLRFMIKNMLMHYVPEIKDVVHADSLDTDTCSERNQPSRKELKV